ncbi:MAG: radical SAM protein [Syntrophomonadaceae bacterium]
MNYEGIIYRPPSEANSLLIQATVGCPHNKCTFCSMYKQTRFRIKPVSEIINDLNQSRDFYGDWVQSIFFPDGNTIIMKTDDLVKIFEHAHSLYPNLKRITLYGSARFVNRKSPAELSRLRQAGLTRVHTGMESGDDITLEKIKKGVGSEAIIAAGLKLKEASIQISEYYLVGIGGTERTEAHAVNSARVLNSFSPDFIRLRTYVPMPGTPLYDDYKQGVFNLLSPHQALRETRLLIENLDCKNSLLLSDHISNYCNVNGLLPGDKENMLQEIDLALQIPESDFRPPHLSHL